MPTTCTTQLMARLASGLVLLIVPIGAFYGRGLQRAYEAPLAYLGWLGAALLLAGIAGGLLFAACGRGAKPAFPVERFVALLLSGAVAGIFAVVCESLVQLPIERVHFMKYGSLSFFFFFSQYPKPILRRTIISAFAASVVGIAEECSQLFIPERFFDPHDIVLNVAACGLGAALAASVRLIRKWDGRERPGSKAPA